MSCSLPWHGSATGVEVVDFLTRQRRAGGLGAIFVHSEMCRAPQLAGTATGAQSGTDLHYTCRCCLGFFTAVWWLACSPYGGIYQGDRCLQCTPPDAALLRTGFPLGIFDPYWKPEAVCQVDLAPRGLSLKERQTLNPRKMRFFVCPTHRPY